MIGNHLAIGIGHCAHAVPVVVGSAVNIGAHIGGAHQHRANSLYHLASGAVVVGLASRGVLHQRQPATAVIASCIEECLITIKR